jgi:hypothetical protein
MTKHPTTGHRFGLRRGGEGKKSRKLEPTAYLEPYRFTEKEFPVFIEDMRLALTYQDLVVVVEQGAQPLVRRYSARAAAAAPATAAEAALSFVERFNTGKTYRLVVEVKNSILKQIPEGPLY